MVILATGLIILGGLTALMGLKIFRVILPIIGLVAGLMVGFSGTQAVFGTGAVSTTIAIVMALIVAVIMALLSFVFYDLAITVLTVIVGATALSYLGIALGLENNGFILLLLAIAGGVLGFMLAVNSMLSVEFVVLLTAFLGVGYVLAGTLLLVGELSVDELHAGGIIPAVVDTVDQSFLWLFAWIGGSVAAGAFQNVVAAREVLGDQYEYKVN